MGKRLGDDVDPLLVSVRSGAPFSMPGMMDTVLNLGLNDDSVQGLAKQTGNERFAFDSYRRFVQMFGKIVLDVPGDDFEEALHELMEDRGVAVDTDLSAEDLRGLVATFKAIVQRIAGVDFPDDPHVQLGYAIEAVFKSWNGRRAKDYRRMERIPDDLGTAVNVQTMVYGNKGEDSGTGVAFTRNPSSGEQQRRTATSSPTPRARTWWPGSGSPSRSTRWRTTSRIATGSCWRSCRVSSCTTTTCATSSSRSSRVGSSSCRPAWASAPRWPRCGWRWRWSPRASSTSARPSCGSSLRSSTSSCTRSSTPPRSTTCSPPG